MEVFDLARGTDEGINLLTGTGEFIWAFGEVVQSEGDEIRGAGAADENVDYLVDDSAVRKGCPSFRVLYVKKGVQQILLFDRLVTSLGDNLSAIVTTNLDILVECTLVQEPIEELGSRGSTYGFEG